VAQSSDGFNVGISTNFGTTWSSNTISGQILYSVASSADGGKLVAGTISGGIYTMQSTVSPKINLTASNNSLVLSWLIPSTNFVPQKSSDLVSWEDMTNQPLLNLTNLNNELTLSPTNSSGFFRLSTP